ncbi:MAG: alpha/beta fold hydrolase [Elusimicrobia bacterium]|nr:alpha/beta fold hydrolase [Elusimicrobiota bacterium]MDE2510303.1 alpha/beta fold hydrolase [Elusimicrobiota bacterium]
MKLSVRESGDPKGLPVVLLHAFPLSSAMWEPQYAALAAYRVLAPDLRGFGGTPLSAPWFIEHAVDDVLESVPEKCVFVGLSMGGYVALRLAEKAPGRVRALVLCDTRAEGDANENKIKRAAAVDFVRSRGVAAFAEPFFRDALAPATLTGKPKVLEFLKGIAAKASPEAVTAAMAALAARGDMVASLPGVKVPTSVMVGSQDKITPLPLAELLRTRIPGAELHIIPDAGHFSNAENPAAFNERLVSFLKRL